MTTLQGEDKEADDLFWNQDAFKEEDEADKDYVFKKQGDIIDSDFDISEAEEEAAPVEDERRGSTKRKSTYADPVLRAQKRRARALLKRQGGGAPAKRKPHRGPAGPLPPSSMSRRHSTKAKSARTTEAQSAHAIAAKARGVKRAARLSKSAPEKTTWTQEEMLLAAVDTEWVNLTAARRIMRKRKAARGAVAPAPLARRVHLHQLVCLLVFWSGILDSFGQRLVLQYTFQMHPILLWLLALQQQLGAWQEEVRLKKMISRSL
jgi:hypothetical protein